MAGYDVSSITRKRDTPFACFNRMREFYYAEELDIFCNELMMNGYDYNDGLRFLDIHTRVDYMQTRGFVEPDICDYLDRYIRLKNMEEI
jgi:hypothetical protein